MRTVDPSACSFTSAASGKVLLELQSRRAYKFCYMPTRFSPTLPQSQITSHAATTTTPPPTISRRRAAFYSIFTITTTTSFLYGNGCNSDRSSWAQPTISDFIELPDSGGVKALDLRVGDDHNATPSNGDKVVIHYYGRLAAKQGWRFDSTYDHKDVNGEPIPFEFVLGSRKVISGIESAVRSMKVGGIRRVIIPPSQGYQNTSQEPIPPNFFDRQRLFTTIFNPTRLANGEGSTLGTLIFDIELVSLRPHEY